MASRSQQTHAKRARELAVKERRERKRAKKAENAALRAAGIDPNAVEDSTGEPGDEGQAEATETEWIQ
jgi:hypothetical protein